MTFFRKSEKILSGATLTIFSTSAVSFADAQQNKHMEKENNNNQSEQDNNGVKGELSLKKAVTLLALFGIGGIYLCLKLCPKSKKLIETREEALKLRNKVQNTVLMTKEEDNNMADIKIREIINQIPIFELNNVPEYDAMENLKVNSYHSESFYEKVIKGGEKTFKFEGEDTGLAEMERISYTLDERDVEEQKALWELEMKVNKKVDLNDTDAVEEVVHSWNEEFNGLLGNVQMIRFRNFAINLSNQFFTDDNIQG